MRDPLHLPHERRASLGQLEWLSGQVERGAHCAQQPWHVLQAPLLERRDGPVQLGHDPRRLALEDEQLLDQRLHLRHELNRRRSCPDDRDPRASEIVVVPPARGVKRRARERVEPGYLRDLRFVQRTLPQHEELRVVAPPVGLHDPPLEAVVPGRLDRVGLEVDVRDDGEALRHVEEIRLDLGLLREDARPARVASEGERVHVRRRVARAPGVRVVSPGATDLTGLLDDDEVADAFPQEANAHREPGKAAPDAQDTRLDDLHQRDLAQDELRLGANAP